MEQSKIGALSFTYIDNRRGYDLKNTTTKKKKKKVQLQYLTA